MRCVKEDRMSRLIDADALERDGWRMSRIVQIDEKTMEAQTRKPTDFPTVEPQPEPCEDTISRQSAIQAAECIVDHHAITPYQTMRSAMDHLQRILRGMPSAQLVDKDINVPCTDAIDRQKAIRWVKTECNPYGKPTLDQEIRRMAGQTSPGEVPAAERRRS